MTQYTFTVEKAGSDKIFSGRFSLYPDTSEFNVLNIALDTVCRDVYINGICEGEITSIKATRYKDGEILVSLNGNMDSITAVIRRHDN